jgi:hypothetical protein
MIESFMAVLVQYPFLTLQLAGAVGMFAHWFKRWAKLQTPLGPFAFFWANKRAMFGSFIIQFATVVSMFVTGVPVEVSNQSLALAFLGAFGLNSVFTPHDEPKPEAGGPIK